MKYIAYITLSLSLIACENIPNKKTQNELDALVALMTGSFSSRDQSLIDEDYYDIRLEMIPIWKNNTDGRWLYVEQAVSTSLDKPYRQRIYHVTELQNGQFSSAVFELPNPQKYIGAYADTTRFISLKPIDLTIRKGCAVLLKKTDPKKFTGSTDSNKCLSSLRGASYATSEVTIEPNKIKSWDRGFDADNKHVWGAEKGAYVFVRQ